MWSNAGIFVIIALLYTIWAVRAALYNKRYNKLLAEAGAQLKFSVQQRRKGVSHLRGRLHGMRLSVLHPFLRPRTCRIRIRFPGSLCSPFRLTTPRARGLLFILEKMFPVDTGEPRFAGRLRLSAVEPHRALPLLDKAVRDLIVYLAAAPRELRLSERALTVFIPVKRIKTVEEIVVPIKESGALANHITQKRHAQAMLLHNMEHDPEPGVRLANLQEMVKRYGTNDERRTALQRRLQDENALVQVAAADWLGKQGREHMLHMLEHRDWQEHEIPALRTIVNKVQKYSINEALPGLQAIFRRFHNVKSAQALLQEILVMLRSFKDIDLSPFLVTELEQIDNSLRIPLFQALETCGNLDAVEPLFRSKKGTLNPGIRNAAQKAIDMIQARLGNGEKGWLSVRGVGEQEGLLSKAEIGNGGELSLEKDDSTSKPKPRPGRKKCIRKLK